MFTARVQEACAGVAKQLAELCFSAGKVGNAFDKLAKALEPGSSANSGSTVHRPRRPPPDDVRFDEVTRQAVRNELRRKATRLR